MIQKEKIAIVDHVGAKAGMDYYTLLLAKGLTSYVETVGIFSNFSTQDSRIRFYPIFIQHASSYIKKICNHFFAFLHATIICRKESYNKVIVHLFSYGLKEIYALGVLKMAGLEIIAIVHDVESFAGKDKPLFQKIIFNHLADKLMLHNQFSSDVLTEKYNNKSVKAKVKIIPHGNFHDLPSKKLDKVEARKRLSISSNFIYLLFFGQIKEVKGLEILIKSLPYLPNNVKLIIAGKPWKSDFQAYQKIINNLGLNDRIETQIGFVEDIQRDLLFRACDIIVLPYKQIFQSGVLLMAFSYKLPVVASNLKPMKELIRHGETGFLFDSENEISLANTVSAAITALAISNIVSDCAWNEANEINNWNSIAEKIVNW
ncbi:MAG: glycosyltransferase family 4 protein [Chitinophagaceae bacterium]|jgi:glycosyltransferase involved in cell wall biosynthesis